MLSSSHFLNRLQELIDRKEYSAAEEEFSKSLRAFSLKEELFTDLNVQQLEQSINLLTDLLLKWWKDLNYTPSSEFYSLACQSKSYLLYLFSASKHGSSDVVIRERGLLNKTNYTVEELKMLLFLVSTNSSIKIPWGGFFNHIPNEAITAFVGMLGSLRLKLTERNHHQIQDLIDAAKVAPIPTIKGIEALSPLINVYFMCSNVAHEEKYEIKKWVVKVIEQYTSNLMRHSFSDYKCKTAPSNNKRILVVNEHYHSGHAMYRCWHHMISNLRESYELCGLSTKTATDAIAISDFDRYIELDSELDLESAISKIIELDPDLIIYPSIGMSMLGPMLGSIRLAPYQVVCGGHPSSSYLRNMDYFFIPDSEYAKLLGNDIFSEKVIFSGKGSSTHLLDFEHLPFKKSESFTDIAVNGLIQKVSQITIDVCEQIQKKASGEVRFHFFLGSPNRGVYWLATKKLLEKKISNFELHCQSSYQEYMNTLSVCHFAIPTVPFGGANSNIDLMRLGIPKLFLLDKTDLSGVTDHYHWHEYSCMVGHCNSIEHLVNRAAELCNSKIALNELEKEVSQIKIEQVNNINDARFVEAISKTFSNVPVSSHENRDNRQLSFEQFSEVSSYWFDCVCKLTNLATPSFNLTNDTWSRTIKDLVEDINKSDLSSAYKNALSALQLDSQREVYLAQYLSGLIALLNSHYDDAKGHFKSILSLDDSQVMAKYYLGLVYLKQKEYQLAYETINSCCKSVTFPPVLGAMAVLASIKRDHQKALACAIAAQQNNIEVGNGLVSLARFQSEYFDSSIGDSSALTLAKTFFEEVSVEESHLSLRHLPVSNVLFENDIDERCLTIFVSGDSAYFNRYMIPQAQSVLNQATKKINVHFHIMNPKEGDLERLTLSSSLSGLGIRVSAENCGDNVNGLYYSTARFSRLFQYMDLYPSGILSLDADMLFIDCPYKAISKKDICILHCQSEPIWQEVSAAALYLKPNVNSKQFMANVSHSIIRHLVSEKHPGRWFLDQIALFCAWNRIKHEAYVDTFSPRHKFCDLGHSEDSYIWALSNDKDKQDKYNKKLYELTYQVQSQNSRSFNQISTGKYGAVITNKNDEYVGKSIHNKGTWCDHEIELLMHIVKPGDIIIDAGANYGAFSLPMSRLVSDSGEVHAFEPQRLVFQALNGSLAINSITNVFTYNAGLGAKPGKLSLPELDYHEQQNFGGIKLNSERGSKLQVDIMTIDELGLARISLIKADVEGMELEVLKGAQESISKYRPVLFLENHIGNTQYEALIGFCKELDYKLFWHGPDTDRMMLCVPSEKQFKLPPLLPVN